MIQIDKIAKYGNWAFRALVLIGLCANLYLTSTFVTRAEFRDAIKTIEDKREVDNTANTDAHLKIQLSISDIATALKIMAATQTSVNDHETRIRVVEKNQADVMARLARAEQDIGKIK